MKTRIKSKSFEKDKASSAIITPNERSSHPREFFPFSFVFCLLYLLSRNVSLASLLLLASNFFFFSSPSSSYVVVVFIFSIPSFSSLFLFSLLVLGPILISRSDSRIHVSFHSSANIHTNIFQSSTTRYTKVISRAPSACVVGSVLLLPSRYLNFILMFVPSINFYNPFINLIKTKHNTKSSLLPFHSFQPPPAFDFSPFFTLFLNFEMFVVLLTRFVRDQFNVIIKLTCFGICVHKFDKHSLALNRLCEHFSRDSSGSLFL